MEILYAHQNLKLLLALWSGQWDGVAWYNLHLAEAGLRQVHDFSRLLVLEALPDLELYPHQREALLRVMTEMGGRAILADEVGLGKTIEAGAIIKEYLLRGMARRVLILVPPSLLPQWETELREKFALEPCTDPACWGEHDLILASLELAKRQPHTGNLLRYTYDLVVVDEAHRLRNRQTAGWNLVNRLRRRYLLLLTATPVQNNLRELYNLVTLLKPGQLKTYPAFRREFMLDEHSPKNPDRLRELIRQVMIRTRRQETGDFFPPRHVQDLLVPLYPAEERLYHEVLAAVREAYQLIPPGRRKGAAVLLTLILLLREICSSAPAAAATMAALRGRAELPAVSRQKWGRLIQRARNLQRLAKIDALLQLWPDLPRPVLVFTEFRRTQDLILERLREKGITGLAYHGGLSSAGKQAVLAAFREGAEVMVSTDTGGEGLNLQFCRSLVNFDLPWNPMRLEQRIGRVHRLGQRREVYIYNLATVGTIEERVLELIRQKIRLFETVIGELDLILGSLGPLDLEKRIGEAALSATGDAELQARLEAIGQTLAKARARYEDLRELNNALYDGEWREGVGGRHEGTEPREREGLLAGTP